MSKLVKITYFERYEVVDQYVTETDLDWLRELMGDSVAGKSDDELLSALKSDPNAFGDLDGLLGLTTGEQSVFERGDPISSEIKVEEGA